MKKYAKVAAIGVGFLLWNHLTKETNRGSRCGHRSNMEMYKIPNNGGL